ncbi:MAG: hypothetical protein AAF882_19835 [Pseudomonadota bacterium]
MSERPADWEAMLLAQGIPGERVGHAVATAERLIATADAVVGDPAKAAAPVSITATLLAHRSTDR